MILLGGAATAPAQPAPPPAAPSWWQGAGLTGDWGGLRPRLGATGLTPYAVYTAELLPNVAGGLRTGTDWTSQLEFGLDVDLEKLAGLAGGAAHASFLWIEGTDPSQDRVGNLNTISGLSAAAAARVYQLWYRQALGPVSVKLGQVVASDDFMVSANANLYLNAGFGTSPVFTANINAPTYPLGGPGAVVAWQASDDLQLQSGVYVGDAGPNAGTNDGFGWRTGRGWVIFSEAGYKADVGGRPGVYKAGGYYHTGRFADVRTGAADAHRGNGSLYMLADQTLLGSAETLPVVAAFAGVGWSPQQDRNTVRSYGQTGLNVTGLVPSRPKDVLGLGASYTRFTDDFVAQNRAAGTPVTRQEVIVELTWQVPLTPFLVLQPDLQLVFDANQSRRDAVVLGLRLQATF